MNPLSRQHALREWELFKEGVASELSVPAPDSVMVAVQLKVSDWNSLINFVGGDLPSMAEGDENKQQMNRILDVIRIACAKASSNKVSAKAGRKDTHDRK